MTRRRFLQRASATVAGFFLEGCARDSEEVAISKDYMRAILDGDLQNIANIHYRGNMQDRTFVTLMQGNIKVFSKCKGVGFSNAEVVFTSADSKNKRVRIDFDRDCQIILDNVGTTRTARKVYIELTRVAEGAYRPSAAPTPL